MRKQLGAFSQHVLAAVRLLTGEGYGVTIHRVLVERTGRDVALGSIYATLDRLEDKGFVSSRVGCTTPERGGRAKRHFAITGKGVKALESAWAETDKMRTK